MDFLKTLDGKKTYLAAAGLLGLALFQFSSNDLAGMVQSLLAALAAAGLRRAVEKVTPGDPPTPQV